MDCVKNAKSKMMDHRTKAEGYERLARAFAINPNFTVRLTVDDINYFRLEG